MNKMYIIHCELKSKLEAAASEINTSDNSL